MPECIFKNIHLLPNVIPRLETIYVVSDSSNYDLTDTVTATLKTDTIVNLGCGSRGPKIRAEPIC